MEHNTIYNSGCLEGLKTLPDNSVHCCVTSPPYWGLRDYGVDGQLGLEKTPEEFVEKMVQIFTEVKRVLREDGTLWLNLGDSYSGSGKGKGGGYWYIDDEREHLYLYGKSIDFGKLTLKQLVEAKNTARIRNGLETLKWVYSESDSLQDALTSNLKF